MASRSISTEVESTLECFGWDVLRAAAAEQVWGRLDPEPRAGEDMDREPTCPGLGGMNQQDTCPSTPTRPVRGNVAK